MFEFSYASIYHFRAIAKRKMLQQTYYDLQHSQHGHPRVDSIAPADPLLKGDAAVDDDDDDVVATATALARQAARIQREVKQLLTSRFTAQLTDDDADDN